MRFHMFLAAIALALAGPLPAVAQIETPFFVNRSPADSAFVGHDVTVAGDWTGATDCGSVKTCVNQLGSRTKAVESLNSTQADDISLLQGQAISLQAHGRTFTITVNAEGAPTINAIWVEIIVRDDGLNALDGEQAMLIELFNDPLFETPSTIAQQTLGKKGGGDGTVVATSVAIPRIRALTAVPGVGARRFDLIVTDASGALSGARYLRITPISTSTSVGQYHVPIVLQLIFA
jgi:hypothetical protein